MLFILLINIIAIIDGLKCTAKTPCGCELDNGDYIDLSPMMGAIPMFIGVGLDGGVLTFNVDLCQKYTCVNASEAFICGTAFGLETIVADKLSSFEVDDGTKIPTFVYTATNGTTVATTRVTMHCDTGHGTGSLSSFEMPQSNVFTTTLKSQYACWRKSGGGGGGGGGGGSSANRLSNVSVLYIVSISILYLLV